MTSFRPYEPDQQLLLPPSLRDWLPSDHLVWFISETVDQLDVGEQQEEKRSLQRPCSSAHRMRRPSYPSWIKRYVSLGREGKAARTPKPEAHATRRMAKTLQSKRGRTKYKQRKHIAEPPFGWVKRGLGFRQFSLRGLRKVAGEFNLVCMAMNLRRMANMIRWA